jgi:molybdate transport repressor ModE-like protein
MPTTPNIPTEIIRTVVAIAETGSLTRAAKKLNISQPAVTAQIKRVQELIGGTLFDKTSNGSVPTELGRLVVEQARRILAANDQMMRLGGLAIADQPVRLGYSAVFLDDLFHEQHASALDRVTLKIDSCAEIAKGLVESFVDIACFFDEPALPAEIRGLIVAECNETIVWVRAPDFVLTPGRPIPILLWPGDTFLIDELAKRTRPYNVVMHSRDYSGKLKAAAKGFGITAMPKRFVPDTLIEATEDYLPELAPGRALLCARAHLSEPARAMTDRIAALNFSGRQ